jgi:ArsR family transcriptional regulator
VKLSIDISAYTDMLISMKTTAQIFKTLSDETRLRIMSLLITGQELCVCDIIAVLDLPQSTVSRHLAYLRNSNLLEDRRQGIWMYYRINQDIEKNISYLFDILAIIFNDNDQVALDRQSLKDFIKVKTEKNANNIS